MKHRKPFSHLSARQKIRRFNAEYERVTQQMTEANNPVTYVRPQQSREEPASSSRKNLLGTSSLGGVSDSDSSDSSESEHIIIYSPLPLLNTRKFLPQGNAPSQVPVTMNIEGLLKNVMRELHVVKKELYELKSILKENVNQGKAQEQTPATMRYRPPPANTPEELDYISQLPEMIQLLKETQECTLSRTITHMLKLLLSKELALKYSLTGLGRSKGQEKIPFKNSPAFRAVEHAVVSSEMYRNTPRKEVYRCITHALKNAGDWHGRQRVKEQSRVLETENGNRVVNEATGAAATSGSDFSGEGVAVGFIHQATNILNLS